MGRSHVIDKKLFEITKLLPEEIDYVAIANIVPHGGYSTDFKTVPLSKKIVDKLSYLRYLKLIYSNQHIGSFSGYSEAVQQSKIGRKTTKVFTKLIFAVGFKK